MAKKINVKTLKEDTAKILNVVQDGEPLTVTERSRPVAVIVDFRSFAAMQERLRQLEEAELLRALAEGREEYRQGRTRKVKSLRELRS